MIPVTNLSIQADVETLLPEDIEEFEQNVSGTGEDETFDKLLVLVEGDELFTVDNLQLLEKTFLELDDLLPVVETASPFSNLSLEKSGARLVAVPLSPNSVAPVDEKTLQVFKNRIKNSRFAPGFVCSIDRSALAFYLIVEKTDSYVDQIKSIEEVLKPLREVLDVTITGTSPFSAETELFLTTGFPKLLVFVLITILLSYYIGFRSKRAVFLPVTLIISGTVFALGIMSLAGYQLTMVSIISPPLILTLGSSYSIHVMNAYFSASGASSRDKKDTIINSVYGVSNTILLASATTLIGLMSLMFATIPQAREFAVSTALGVFFCAVLSVTLLPAFLSLQPVPSKTKLNTLKR
ncbi:MAG TPA: hypothetical protein DCO79_01285, partial [Spirochaeta sp.]|nr:hypothetical protein [Spirochaeta sp.]